MHVISERTAAVLDWVAGFMKRNGYAPTSREIGAGMDIASTNGVRYHLGVLERSGYLERTPLKIRAMRLTHRAKRLVAQRASDAESTA